MKKAFTLAEVLITLGIVGVIAALTLPSLITNYKVKVLEARFKEADALISQALLKTANEAGYDSIQSFNIPWSEFNNTNYTELKRQVDVMNEIWPKQFKGIEPINFYNFYPNKTCKGMTGQVDGGNKYCWGGYQLPNGMIVGKLSAAHSGPNYPGIVQVFFDTNGPQGPNRWGHDIFVYLSDITYNARSSCNPSIPISTGHYYCYYYAHNNINTADKNKPYWDMLFKPLSYWQKSDK